MKELLSTLGITELNPGAYGAEVYESSKGDALESHSPINNELIGSVQVADAELYEKVIKDAHHCFLEWRKVPAPERGALVREVGEALRENKRNLGKLITIEMGKILAEGEGEVQEAIDIADFALGLSRQLYGKTMHSERPAHRMYEQWHPLGVVGVISAFNFPAAVWAWNAMIAAVCGDTILWKPSRYVPLTAIAINNICREVAVRHGFPALFSLVVGGRAGLGSLMTEDRRIPLISATGSCQMGRAVAQSVGKRLGRCILELGGNNAIIITKEADLDLAIPATVFGSVGTAGQRCTSTRRILVDKSIEEEFTKRLINAYKQVRIGDPLKSETLMGPLVHSDAVAAYKSALKTAKEQGAKILYGGKVKKDAPSDLYVEPVIVKANKGMAIIQEETFAPILYVIGVKDLDEAIEVHNAVPQGLSSAIFTRNLQEAENFLAATGSDCGIANVNIGTSGAEIGGAFGGEKDTGGGRESGSDSWKQYMRRQTNTINYSKDLPLAQGIKFDL